MEEARQSAVIERLKAREAQRSAEASRRQHEQQEAGVEKESAAAFLADFAARRGALEAAVQGYAAEGGGGDAAARNLADQVAQLEQAVAAAAYFLPPYDLRAATAAAAGLRDALQAATLARQPRKKFSFSKKPAAPAAPPPEPPAAPPSEPSAAAAPAAPPAGLTISGLRDRQVFLTAADVGPTQDVTLADLEDCSVWLLAPLGALFAHRLTRCTVVAGPVDGALHAEDLTGCAVHAAARQARIHAARDCSFYLRLRAGPIIEHSAGLAFAPLAAGGALGYPGAGAALEAQDLAADGGQWGEVHDFGWLRAAASPHWRVLPEGEREPPPPPPPPASPP